MDSEGCVHHEILHSPSCDCGVCVDGKVLSTCIECGRKRMLPSSWPGYDKSDFGFDWNKRSWDTNVNALNREEVLS